METVPQTVVNCLGIQVPLVPLSDPATWGESPLLKMYRRWRMDQETQADTPLVVQMGSASMNCSTPP